MNISIATIPLRVGPPPEEDLTVDTFRYKLPYSCVYLKVYLNLELDHYTDTQLVDVA